MNSRMSARQKFVNDGILKARSLPQFAAEGSFDRVSREVLAREFLGKMFDRIEEERNSPLRPSDIAKQIRNARTFPDFCR